MKKLRRALTRTALALGGALLMMVLLTLLMILFPRPFVGPIDRYERTEPNLTRELFYRNIDGDLFTVMPGMVRPPETEEMLAQFMIAWDADGFRVPERQADVYPIAIFGDSFTEAVNVARPWPDLLADALDVPVQNYAYRGYGPREIARAADEFLGSEPRAWAVYGYFSGNDLGDALSTPRVDVRSPLALWQAFFERFSPPQQAIQAETNADDTHYDYPMAVIIGSQYYELALLPYYLWWHVGDIQTFSDSVNFDVLTESLMQFAAASDAQTCRMFVFMPTKEQLYYRYIHPDKRQWLRAVAQELTLEQATRELTLINAPFTEEEEPAFLARLTSQRDAVRARVESLGGWHFVDLLPVFEEAVARGELLYYPYDTHWNQDGHALAAQTVAEYMRAHPECE